VKLPAKSCWPKWMDRPGIWTWSNPQFRLLQEINYAGYQNGVGVGNKLQFGTSGEDDFAYSVTTVTSGSVYALFL